MPKCESQRSNSVLTAPKEGPSRNMLGMYFVCLFVLMLYYNVPVNNFSVMLGRSHHFLGITSTFRGVNVSLLKEKGMYLM